MGLANKRRSGARTHGFRVWRAPLDFADHSKHRNELTLPTHLNRQTRVILGLMWMGLSAGEMGVALGVTDFGAMLELFEFVRRIKNSRLPVIQDAIKYGLPRHCVSALPNNFVLRCPNCRHRVQMVPCPSCARVPHLLKEQKFRAIKEPPLPAPTLELPGSRAKIEVMRLRRERGQAIFSPDDAKFSLLDTVSTVEE